MIISGLGQPSQALNWIAEGADIGGAANELDDDVATAVEFFNLSGFEPSPRAAFVVGAQGHLRCQEQACA